MENLKDRAHNSFAEYLVTDDDIIGCDIEREHHSIKKRRKGRRHKDSSETQNSVDMMYVSGYFQALFDMVKKGRIDPDEITFGDIIRNLKLK